MQSARSVSLLVVVVCLCARAFSQATPDVEQGMKPFGSYHGGNLDRVNLTNGNLFFHADLFSYPQRGGELGYSIALEYNGKNFSTYQPPCPPGNKCPFRQYILFGPNPLRTQNKSNGNTMTIGFEGFAGTGAGYIDSSLSSYGNEIYVKPLSAVTIDGAVHQLASTNTGMVALDGSGYAAASQTSPIAVDRNGTASSLEISAIDRNGNQASGSVDTLGRNIPSAPTAGGPGGTPPASTASLSSCPSLSYSFQPANYAYTWNLPTVNSGVLPLILCYTGVYVRTGAGTPGPPIFQVSENFWMLQSVVFPDNTYWAFEYDAADPNNTNTVGFGDLLKVTFPTGGSLTYTWALSTMGCHSPYDRAVQTRTVNDGTGPHTWTYSYGSQFVVTVTDPLGNDTLHTISELGAAELGGASCSLYETETQYYQGSHSGGTLLKTVNIDYQYTMNPYDPAVIGSGGVQTNATTVTNVFPIRVTTTLPNGLVSKVETDYDTALAYHGPLDGITWNVQVCDPDGACTWNNQTNGVTNYTGSYGKPVAVREYDWGQGTSGSLLRRTLTTYQWQVNSAYLSANLLDLPASVQVLDGAGNQVSLTTYGYDEYSVATSGAPQLAAAPWTVRGNQTSVHHWLSGSTTSTTNCPISVSNGYLVSYAQYNDTGTVASTTDPCGTKAGDTKHTTTHTYSSTYAGAYPTQTCNPLGQCVNGVYDFDTGLLTSFSDANSQTTNYSYDNRWRMTQALFPPDSSGNRPETDFDYSVLNQVKRSKKQASNSSNTTWIYDYAYFDGLGRTIQTRLVDPEGDDFVDTSYDALGRVSTVSNPHRSGQSQTDGTTTTYYDALSRLVQVAPQDGTVLAGGTSVTQCQANNTCTDYSNSPTVTVTDEAGKMRRTRSDALGRLVEVDEPGGGVNGPGTPGSGNITISGSLSSSTTPGTQATGSVTVSGFVQTIFIEVCNDTCIRERKTDPGGTVTITVNGHANSVTYNSGSTANSLASALITQINGDGGAFVWASGPSCGDGNDCTVSLQARTPGPNYSLSASGSSNDEADGFTSFDGTSASGSSLTGGVYPVTTYDSGTVTVTVDGFTASAAYSQNQNSTASAVASALANALNVSGSPVTGSVSGTTITLTAKPVGTASDYSVSGSSTASFTASSTTLSGGTNPGGIYTPFVTSYTYDTLGNLIKVNQTGDGSQGARVRTFTYDSLSQLLTANNPESGTITYTYDADSNVITKTDARAITTTYVYDILNRLTSKSYSDGTPAPRYQYDAACCGVTTLNPIGRMTGAFTNNTEVLFSYDPMGNVLTQWDCPPSGIARGWCYVISAQYNLVGDLAQLTYPNGEVVNFLYNTASGDSSGRLGAVENQGNGINYASGPGGGTNYASHIPDGSPSSYINGYTSSFAGTTNTFTYNNRLQPVTMSAASPAATVFSLTYDFHAGANNNGNVYAITNNKDSTRNQSFTYDQLNRLISAQNAGTNCSATTANGRSEYWGNSYGYDAWGNLLTKTVTKCSAENLQETADTQNRMHATSGTDYTYDAAGNMTHDVTFNHYYSYDAESRIAQVDSGATAYTYNAEDNRVRKDVSGSPSNEYFYFGGNIIAELNPANGAETNYIFFNGERVARRDSTGTVEYYFSDHLKTTDIVTDAQGNIKNESDFYPWGGELQLSANDPNNHYKFTGKERDSETGLDYFGARYYSNGLGRFITPDWAAKPAPVPYPVLGDPQSLNLYTYVRNIPTSQIDGDGHCPQCTLVPAMPSMPASARMADDVTKSGGLRGFVKDAAAGMLKAGPQLAFNSLVRLPLAVLLPAPLVLPAIKALQDPSPIRSTNQTQADASLVTQVLGTAMLPGLKGSGASVIAPETEMLRGTNLPGELTSRSSFRVGTIQDAWDDAMLGPNGGRLCPDCGAERSVAPGQGPRDWDLDHQPKWTDRLFSPDTTRQEVVNNYQQGTKLRCPTCNRADNQTNH